MKAVGKDAGRAAGVPERDLGDCDAQIEEEDTNEHTCDRCITTVAGRSALRVQNELDLTLT